MTTGPEALRLACPFCGHSELTPTVVTDGGWFYLCCDKCEAGGPWERSKDEATAAWNRRAQSLADEALLREAMEALSAARQYVRGVFAGEEADAVLSRLRERLNQ